MQKYGPALASKDHPEYDYDYPVAVMYEHLDGKYYLASEVDALLAEHAQNNAAWLNARNVWTLSDKAKDERIKELEKLLHRVIEWSPALPAEASLVDEIGKAIRL